MKANELRIGNFLIDVKNNRHVIFWGINPSWDKITVNYAHGSGIYDLKVDNKEIKQKQEFQPIPLTEEWLLKLPDNEWEFVGYGTRQIWQHKRFEAIKIEYGNGQVFVYFNDELISIKDYLHQLQNLYFALTGEELTIKQNG